MKYIEVEDGRSYYCEVCLLQPTNVNAEPFNRPVPTRLGGALTIKEGDIKLELFRFDEPFFVSEEDRLVARTEGNWTAVLFDTIVFGPGQRGYGELATYYYRVIVNTAIIGWDEWRLEYRVRRASFRVPGSDLLLRHWPIFRDISDSPLGDAPELEVFNAEVLGGRVRVHYSLSVDMDSNYPHAVLPLIEMEFNAELDLRDMRQQIICLLSFLSAAASVHFYASEHTISCLTHTEWASEIEANQYPPTYSVYYNEYESLMGQIQGKPKIFHGAFASVRDDDERAAFVKCLRAWFARDTSWRRATSAMVNAFDLQDVMSPERLLNATRWIEATPGAQASKLISDEHSKALSILIAHAAEKLGYKSLGGRIKGAINLIGNETNFDRFSRLVADLKAFYGPKIVGDDLAAWVAKAFRIRGPAAHQPIIGQTENEYQLFSKATNAAECFAYLLLLRGLPMSQEGRERVASAPFVEFYRLEIKGSLPKDFGVTR